MKKDKISIGTWVQTGSETASEILAYAGFDWVCVDLEHADVDWHTFANIVRAVKRCGGSAMARVTENQTMAIRKALDCGAAGIIVPMVNNAEEAKRAVASAKFPPDGIRGFAFCHANEWGEEFDAYVAGANSEIRLIVMVETKAAVENIDEILDVPGVDGVFIGPYDLSGSYGIPGKTGDPIVTEALQKVAKACIAHGKLAGQHIVVPTEKNVQTAIADGYRFIALGMDTVFLIRGAKECLAYAGRRDDAE